MEELLPLYCLLKKEQANKLLSKIHRQSQVLRSRKMSSYQGFWIVKHQDSNHPLICVMRRVLDKKPSAQSVLYGSVVGKN